MLELKKISKTFNPGTVNEKCALHELSLSVPDGDFITIIGANGAGKSTLFGAISGSFLTDSGEILLDGQDVTLLMATIAKPKLLLLDEHTAALDPGAAEKILTMTTRIAAEQKLTCLMVTHNMRAALALGNRTLMMNGGRIILDVSGEERTRMDVDDLLERFRSGTGEALDNDRILLS